MSPSLLTQLLLVQLWMTLPNVVAQLVLQREASTITLTATVLASCGTPRSTIVPQLTASDAGSTISLEELATTTSTKAPTDESNSSLLLNLSTRPMSSRTSTPTGRNQTLDHVSVGSSQTTTSSSISTSTATGDRTSTDYTDGNTSVLAYTDVTTKGGSTTNNSTITSTDSSDGLESSLSNVQTNDNASRKGSLPSSVIGTSTTSRVSSHAPATPTGSSDPSISSRHAERSQQESMPAYTGVEMSIFSSISSFPAPRSTTNDLVDPASLPRQGADSVRSTTGGFTSFATSRLPSLRSSATDTTSTAGLVESDSTILSTSFVTTATFAFTSTLFTKDMQSRNTALVIVGVPRSGSQSLTAAGVPSSETSYAVRTKSDLGTSNIRSSPPGTSVNSLSTGSRRSSSLLESSLHSTETPSGTSDDANIITTAGPSSSTMTTTLASYQLPSLSMPSVRTVSNFTSLEEISRSLSTNSTSITNSISTPRPDPSSTQTSSNLGTSGDPLTTSSSGNGNLPSPRPNNSSFLSRSSDQTIVPLTHGTTSPLGRSSTSQSSDTVNNRTNTSSVLGSSLSTASTEISVATTPQPGTIANEAGTGSLTRSLRASDVSSSLPLSKPASSQLDSPIFSILSGLTSTSTSAHGNIESSQVTLQPSFSRSSSFASNSSPSNIGPSQKTVSPSTSSLSSFALSPQLSSIGPSQKSLPPSSSSTFTFASNTTLSNIGPSQTAFPPSFSSSLISSSSLALSNSASFRVPTPSSSSSLSSARNSGSNSNSSIERNATIGYVTSLIYVTFVTEPSTYSTVEPSGTVYGTYLVEVPQAGYVTSFVQQEGDFSAAVRSSRASMITAPRTISTVPPSGNVSGTFIVETPMTQTITIFTSYDSTYTINSTTFVSSGPYLVTEEIFTPAPTTVTVTSGFTGIYSTSFITSSPGDSTITLVIETPLPFNTVTTGYDEGPAGTDTLTSTYGFNDTGTERQVIISTPWPYIVETTGYNGTTTLTTTLTPTPTAYTGTVLVETPYPFVTIVTGYDEGPTGTDIITSTIVDQNSTSAVTVVISTPYPYVEIITFYDGGPRNNVTSTSLARPQSSNAFTGALITLTPAPYVTSLFGYDGGPLITDNITIDYPASTGTGTEIVSVPYPYLSSTTGTDEGPDAFNTQTTTLKPSDLTDGVLASTTIGTITILTLIPYPYTTSTSYFTTTNLSAAITTSLFTPSPTEFIGTVSLFVPDFLSISYSGYDGGNTLNTTATTTQSTSNSITLVIVTPFPYVTVTTATDEGPQGSVTSTATVRPDSAVSTGTVVVYTPGAYVTTTVFYDDGPGGTSTVSSTRHPDSDAPVGTLFVSLPYSYINITTEYDGGADATSTILETIPASISPPGSLITSVPQLYITSTTSYDDGPTGQIDPSGTITSTASAATQSGLGTVVISIPDPYVTFTTFSDEGPSGTITSTITSAASLANDSTGSLVVYTPAPYKTSYSQYDNATVSTSIIPASNGTGTVIIFQPSPTPISISYISITTGFGGTTTSYLTTGLTGNPVTVTVFTPDNAVPTAAQTSSITLSTSTIYTGTEVLTTTISPAASATDATGIVIKTYPTCDYSCNNQGIRYAVYNNPYTDQFVNDYPSFNSTYFKGQRPVAQGVTPYVGFAANVRNPTPYGQFSTNIYDQPPQSISQLAVDHTFYICAPVSGNYSFNGIYADDINQIWIGDLAISGWNRSNEDLEQTFNYDYTSSYPASVTVLLTQGYLYPVRVLWGNRFGQGEFNIAIYAPDGGLLLSSNTTDSPYVYTSPNILLNSCDGSAPAFPAWGLET